MKDFTLDYKEQNDLALLLLEQNNFEGVLRQINYFRVEYGK